MNQPGIDLSPLRKAIGWLTEALMLWHAQAEGSVLKPHLRSAVIQSFEFSYELSLRSLRRVLVERAGSADRIIDLSFHELLRHAADAGLVQDPNAWRTWRELRNATSHADDEGKAQQVAHDAERFCVDARALLGALEGAL
ncbi:MAG: HI0074 family nucleotidyltransferase substrate-binding subunit [Aquabacterium sp.]|nr:HI0074 family nucleotidyltransferase substrate-binding subunit [Aquabacterium sp.]